MLLQRATGRRWLRYVLRALEVIAVLTMFPVFLRRPERWLVGQGAEKQQGQAIKPAPVASLGIFR